jgi:hypothetical protein
VRVLLDESVPVQIRKALPGHEVKTSVEIGWRGISNGELLDCAEAAGFDLLIIADKNFQYQQNVTGRRVAILQLWTNHRPTLEKHFEHILTAAQSIRPAQFVALEQPS